MKRCTINEKPYIEGYHTQEFRYNKASLSEPIICKASDAWLGRGFYFWTDIEFAKYWGEDFKIRRTGAYDIYKALINVENCLNTVFNEDEYFFFYRCIEKTIQKFQSDGIEITLKRVHEFLTENFWKNEISGIIYDDLPINSHKKPNRKYSVIGHTSDSGTFFYYKKRIQIVVFDLRNIIGFELFSEEQS